MASIIVEQSFDPPMSDEEYGRLAKRLDPCLDLRHAIWVRSYVATDKRRMICEFEAPDAEAVREAMRSAKVPFDRAWAAEHEPGGRKPGQSVVAELSSATVATPGSIRTYRTRKGEPMFSEYQSDDPQALLTRLQAAGARAWLADVYAIEDFPEWTAKLAAVRARLAAR
jgi:hypothetical protein